MDNGITESAETYLPMERKREKERKGGGEGPFVGC